MLWSTHGTESKNPHLVPRDWDMITSLPQEGNPGLIHYHRCTKTLLKRDVTNLALMSNSVEWNNTELFVKKKKNTENEPCQYP